MSIALDPALTFGTFVIGPGNRLAAAAARRTAEAPGASYNPLVIHSPSGLGKTHLLHALAALALEVEPELALRYETLEGMVDRLSAALAGGSLEEFRAGFVGLDLLLLDDVQFLAGKPRTQEELLRIWDEMNRVGSQVVLALDRPPAEMDGLDQRLSTRFSSGLILDILPPNLETRVAIIRRKAEDRGLVIGPGVAEAMARALFDNVRELQGGLNRIAAVQDLEHRTVAADEVRGLLGDAGREEPTGEDEFGAFLSDITFTVSNLVEAAPWRKRVAEMILRYEGEGIRTRRLEQALEADSAPNIDQTLAAFAAEVERLRELAAEATRLDMLPADAALFHDPDRLEEAEAYLVGARAAAAPLATPPGTGTLADWAARYPALRLAANAARRAVEPGDDAYNPLVFHGADAEAATALLQAIGNEAGAKRDRVVTYVRGAELAREIRRALSSRTVELWRRRYAKAALLLLDGAEMLGVEEREQEELFHLLDTVLRAGTRLVLASAQPPRALSQLDSRLRSRFEGGLVVDLAPPAGPEQTEAAAPQTPETPVDRWYYNAEKVAWSWVALDDRLVEDLT